MKTVKVILPPADAGRMIRLLQTVNDRPLWDKHRGFWEMTNLGWDKVLNVVGIVECHFKLEFKGFDEIYRNPVGYAEARTLADWTWFLPADDFDPTPDVVVE